MTDPLDDPDVLAALKIMGSHARHAATLCPSCGRAELDDDEDFCRRCTDQAAASADRRSRESKATWWRGQSDYPALRRKHGALEGAVRWLRHRLRKEADGVPASRIRHDADNAGISRRTLRRARDQMAAAGQLEVLRRGGGDHTPPTVYWRLARGVQDGPDGHHESAADA